MATLALFSGGKYIAVGLLVPLNLSLHSRDRGRAE
jgi:hypothetical protein